MQSPPTFDLDPIMVKCPVHIAVRPFLSVLAAVSLVGCGEQRPAGEAEVSSVASAPLLMASAAVALPPAGVSVADLPDPQSNGARLVGEYCSACHAISSPTTHSATDWPAVMRRMWLRMDHLGPEFNVPRPTSAERLALLNYMRDNALVITGAALPDGPGRDTFVETCGQCHDLPDPKQHSPEDWIAVVQRMSGRIETMLGKRLSQQDMTRITLYLETVTRGSE